MKKLIATLVLSVTFISAYAQTFQYEELYYNILNEADKTCEVTKNPKATGRVVIPETVTYTGNQYTVTSIGEYAFAECSGLTSINLSENLTSIEYAAFSNCTGLTSITLPESLTSIGHSAFWRCTGLTSIDLPKNLTSIGDMAFGTCNSLIEINVPSENNNFVSINGVLFTKDVTSLIAYPGGKSGGYTMPNSVTSVRSGAFIYCTGLTVVTFSQSLTSIGEYAFGGCFGLTSVTLPQSLTSIGGFAFGGCSGLTSVTLPQNLTSIGQYAFESCSGLTSINLPKSLTSIELRAFSYCSNLRTVNSYATIPPVCGPYAFYEIPSDAELHVPVGTKDAYDNTSGWWLFDTIIDDLTEEAGVEEIKSESLDVNPYDAVEVYNLQGKKMTIAYGNELPSLPAGIYIVNGKKVLIK